MHQSYMHAAAIVGMLKACEQLALQLQTVSAPRSSSGIEQLVRSGYKTDDTPAIFNVASTGGITLHRAS